MEKIAFASESNNFTLGREVLTASGGHPATASAENSTDNKQRRTSQATSSHATNHNLLNNGNVVIEASDNTLRGNNLPSMLQNMKSQMGSNH